MDTSTTQTAALRRSWERAAARYDRAVAIVNDSGDVAIHGVTEAVVARLFRAEQRAQAKYVAAVSAGVRVGEVGVRVTFSANLLLRTAEKVQHEGEIAYWQTDALGTRAMVYPACLMFYPHEMKRAA